MAEAWRGFKRDGHWDVDVNVRNFIQTNYTPYDGDESFLEGPTEATDKLWGRLQELQKEEREHNGVLECETEIVSSLTAYGPGYIDESMKDLEQIVGLQTDKPLKRAFMQTVLSSCFFSQALWVWIWVPDLLQYDPRDREAPDLPEPCILLQSSYSYPHLLNFFIAF